MAADEVWLPEKHVRPRLSLDELWTLYRLVDDRYWLLRRQPHPFWDFRKVSRIRLKLMMNPNKMRKPEHQISPRERTY